MSLSQPGPDIIEICVAGAGVSFPEHLSIETIEALGRCAVICTSLPEKHLEGLPGDLREKCRSLWPMFIEGRLRTENYTDVVAEVLRTAETARSLAWLTSGHPLIFDSVSANLVRQARARGWRVSVLPAISSLDTILSEVEYDPAGGLFIHEATALVASRIPIPSNVAVMLLQPSAFNTDVAKLTLDYGMPDLAPFRDYLLKFYDGAHRCAFVCSASRYTGPARLVWTTVGEMTEVPHRGLAGSTLFIPRNERRTS
jgi:precorrin-6B methylase 1